MAGLLDKPSPKRLLRGLAALAVSGALIGQGDCSGEPPLPPPEEEPSWVAPESEDGNVEEEGGRPSRSPAQRSKRRKRRKPARSLTVTEVIDGDTVDTDKLGRVRLIGVDTPERGSCYDDAATDFTESEIGGRRVRYELGAERTDPYGRTLAYLYRGGMHNLALVREGYARVLTIPPNDKYESRFEAAERQARRRDEGLWRSCGRANSSRQGSGRRPKRARRSGGSLPSPPPDLDCSDVSGSVRVGSSDPHRLDADGDGVGCE